MTCCTVIRRFLSIMLPYHWASILSLSLANVKQVRGLFLQPGTPKKYYSRKSLQLRSVANAVDCTRITIWQEVGIQVMRERPHQAQCRVTLGSLFGKRWVLVVYCPFNQITYLLGLLRSGGSIAKQRLLDSSRAWTKPCLHNVSKTLHP